MQKSGIRLFVFLIALMLITAVTAWAGGASALKGKDFSYGNWWADYSTDTFKPQNDGQEKTLEWRKKIQKDNGFTMREKKVGDWGTMLELMTTSIMAGRPEANIAIVEGGWAMALQKQNLLYPISDSKAIDFKNTEPVAYQKPAYSQSAMATFTFGGKGYATALIGGTAHTGGVYWNKRLFREAGLDPNLPYDMQKAGTWTWDAFRDISRKLTRDTNNDGRVDTYAMCEDFVDNMLEMFVFSNGGKWVDKDAQGRFVNATGRPEFIEAIQFLLRLRADGVMLAAPENPAWDWIKPPFTDGIVAMYVAGQTFLRDELQQMTDDWGWVLPPKGPKAKDYMAPDDEAVLVVPATYKPEEVDAILTAFNLWVTPVDTDWKSSLYSLYRDARAVDETTAMIRSGKYTSFRYNSLIPGLVTGDISWGLWWWEGEPAQLVESVSANWNAQIADANRR